MRVALMLALTGLAAVAAPAASAQAPLPPSLSVDTAFTAPSGIARDNSPTTTTDVPADVAVDGDRIYTVGESGGDVAIYARRTNGVLDTGFSDDGRLILPIATGTRRDIGVAMVVLPDHRLRVLASTNFDTTSTTNTDVAIVGLNGNGTPDLTFGNHDTVVDGRTIFPVSSAAGADTPTRMSVDPATGRLAISGFVRTAAGRDDTFIALRAADGSPVNEFDGDGLIVTDRGQGGNVNKNDRAVDVAFRPGGGLIALLQVATNADGVSDLVTVLHGFTDTGADDARFSPDPPSGDLVLGVGDPNTIPGALRVHAGRLWVTGSTRVGTDTDAFLARLEPDGSGLQSRRFDMRGGRIAPDQAVVSRGLDLDVVAGTPNTLVVGGSVELSSQSQPRPFWAAAAFNGIEGPLAAAGYGDVLIPTDENAEAVSVAAGAGWVATSAWLRTTTGVIESSFGTARLLVDADKRCDLTVDVPAPLEVQFEGNRSATMTVRVTNVGTRACAGVVTVPSPYGISLGARRGSLPTGMLLPGASYTAGGVGLSYSGARLREDVLRVTVRAAGDANGQNDATLVGVIFSFCDLQLRPDGSTSLAPTEGSRRFEFALRNAGTVPCRRARLASGAGVRSRRSTDPFTLEAGRSASEEISAAVAGPRRIGRRARLTFRALADGDVDRANDSVVVSPLLVGVGDTNARRPTGRILRFSGRAANGRGPASRRRLRLSRVHVAVRRLGRGCRWLSSRRAGFRRASSRRCDRAVWLRAKGTRRWRFDLLRSLPRGGYVLYSRATIAAGFPEASFSARDRNRVAFRVR